jgi:anti-sigma factor RsiW
MRNSSTLAALVLLGCAVQRAPDDAKILVIRWQRLVDESKQTCPRCRTTEVELDEAVERLRRALAPSDGRVELEKTAIDQATFDADPLASNRIWIAGRPLEEWLEGSVGESPCSSSCGDRECRTVCIGADVYEAISADLIVRAGLRAASTLLNSPGNPAGRATRPAPR